MHIKRIHEMMEKLTKCAEMELEKGVENVDTKEMGEVVDIIKDLAEAEYYAKISKAMDESEYGEDYDFGGAYEDDMRKGYRGQPRDAMGRYKSRRGRKRMGYDEVPYLEEPPYWHMTPEMYREHEPEYWRDMDRNTMGRMYYTEGSTGGSMVTRMQGSQSSGGSSGGMSGGSSKVGGSSRDYEEGRRENQKSSRSENARRGYEETKMMQDGSPESKKKAMESLENYMKELGEDMSELVGKMDSNEKNMLRTKLQTLAQKVQ